MSVVIGVRECLLGVLVQLLFSLWPFLDRDTNYLSYDQLLCKVVAFTRLCVGEEEKEEVEERARARGERMLTTAQGENLLGAPHAGVVSGVPRAPTFGFSARPRTAAPQPTRPCMLLNPVRGLPTDSKVGLSPRRSLTPSAGRALYTKCGMGVLGAFRHVTGWCERWRRARTTGGESTTRPLGQQIAQGGISWWATPRWHASST